MKIKSFIASLLLVSLFLVSCRSRNEFKIDKKEQLLNLKKDNDISPLTKLNDTIPIDDSIYRFPDKLAYFHAGYMEVVKFFSDNLKFPENIDNNTDGGTVILKCIIEVDSTASNITIIRGINPDINTEAIRLLKLAKWNPAKHNGEDVRCELAIPIKILPPK